jgi:hypothetical protein
MAIARYSIQCPNCQAKVATSWDDPDGVYLSLPDSFQCRRCGTTITLTERQRQIREIVKQAAVPQWQSFLMWLVTALLLYLGDAYLAGGFLVGWISLGVCVVLGYFVSAWGIGLYETARKNKIKRRAATTRTE